ncbi:peptidoglycan-binding protein LysM [Flavobacterium litorale]|uniref:Peptidoglycan-binding protein LysM n=1 Tax=Flavobacterium litorale TaxID=2856519 RepID=A0ABX8V305_9FLAO|nr:peptidoglycan-binding protein LysM [Flavobacterium litorale]QYJ67219.1 peptidoglycan-binding protein LysM [Flavobacterium litorale]
MRTLNFNTSAGKQIFGNSNNLSGDSENIKAGELLTYIKELGLTYKNIKINTKGSDVKIEGEVEKQSDAEKIELAVGNVKGVGSLENNMRVTETKPKSELYTVESGDTLSKIAKEFYGDANKYNKIFEANQPMLSDPNKIYPGQTLRIPTE